MPSMYLSWFIKIDELYVFVTRLCHEIAVAYYKRITVSMVTRTSTPSTKF